MVPSIVLKLKNSSGRIVGITESMRGLRIASPRANWRSPFSSASMAAAGPIAFAWSSFDKKIGTASSRAPSVGFRLVLTELAYRELGKRRIDDLVHIGRGLDQARLDKIVQVDLETVLEGRSIRVDRRWRNGPDLCRIFLIAVLDHH